MISLLGFNFKTFARSSGLSPRPGSERVLRDFTTSAFKDIDHDETIAE